MDRAIFIAGKKRADNLINVQSLDYQASISFTLDQLKEGSLPDWTAYPRGVFWVLKDKGHRISGMDLTIAGNVPVGGGFSSSAAIEVAMFEMASALFDIGLSQKDKGLFGVEVENRFIGIQSGAMDQLSSALGQAGHALLIDCRSFEVTPIPIPQGVTMMALDTGKRRELLNSEYGKRQEQCREAARSLGVKALRAVTQEQCAATVAKQRETRQRR